MHVHALLAKVHLNCSARFLIEHWSWPALCVANCSLWAGFIIEMFVLGSMNVDDNIGVVGQSNSQ